MVFPSLIFNIEPGTASQFSGMAVLLFSFIIHRIKRLAIVTGLVVLGVCFSMDAFSFYLGPGTHPVTSNHNRNFMQYYGTPWGMRPPVYFYPQLPYHSLWGPQPYYFQPHGLSPYAPQYCPHCQQQNFQPPVFPQNNVNHPQWAS